jgi:N-acetylglutamate synthase-like GNAT family acetyltransferase
VNIKTAAMKSAVLFLIKIIYNMLYEVWDMENNLKIIETENYDEILFFAFDNGVEFDEKNNIYINKPYLGLKLILNNKMIGGVSVCKSNYGDYVLEYLAVNENYRHNGYATLLIEYIFNKLREIKVSKLYLMAHVYEIYKKTGFKFVSDKLYLISNNCLNCESYKNKECVPKVMLKEL